MFYVFVINYWFVRLGEKAKYAEIAYEKGFIAIGWNQLSSAKEYRTRDEIYEALSIAYPQYSKAQLAIQTGQVTRYVLDMQPYDIVLSPTGEGTLYICRVGEYYFEEFPKDDCPYKHRRRVSWSDRVIAKEELPPKVARVLTVNLSIFSLNKYKTELDVLPIY